MTEQRGNASPSDAPSSTQGEESPDSSAHTGDAVAPLDPPPIDLSLELEVDNVPLEVVEIVDESAETLSRPIQKPKLKPFEAKFPPEALKQIQDLKDNVARKDKQIEQVMGAYREIKGETEKLRDRIKKVERRKFEQSKGDFIARFVEVLDNLDRAIDSIENNFDSDSVLQGIILVRSRLVQLLREEGLEKIFVGGQTFDPTYSEAAGMEDVEAPDQDGVVLKELQRGYMLKGSLLRAARVIVGRFISGEAPVAPAPSAPAANAPASPPAEPAPPSPSVPTEPTAKAAPVSPPMPPQAPATSPVAPQAPATSPVAPQAPATSPVAPQPPATPVQPVPVQQRPPAPQAPSPAPPPPAPTQPSQPPQIQQQVPPVSAPQPAAPVPPPPASPRPPSASPAIPPPAPAPPATAYEPPPPGLEPPAPVPDLLIPPDEVATSPPPPKPPAAPGVAKPRPENPLLKDDIYEHEEAVPEIQGSDLENEDTDFFE